MLQGANSQEFQIVLQVNGKVQDSKLPSRYRGAAEVIYSSCCGALHAAGKNFAYRTSRISEKALFKATCGLMSLIILLANVANGGMSCACFSATDACGRKLSYISLQFF